MAARRLNPNRAKLHRTYSARELADLYGVHKNTVREWQRNGLHAVDRCRPTLFAGQVVRTFIAARNASRKRPCPPGALYCFRCREARKPAGDQADYLPINTLSGNLKATCGACATTMHRRVRIASLAVKMPGVDIRVMQAPSRIVEGASPSLNHDSGAKDLT